jgi:hypothetical protein
VAGGTLLEGGLAFKEPRGHVDFYPNSGLPPQPGKKFSTVWVLFHYTAKTLARLTRTCFGFQVAELTHSGSVATIVVSTSTLNPFKMERRLLVAAARVGNTMKVESVHALISRSWESSLRQSMYIQAINFT